MSGGVTSSYVYDADGNRVKETIGPNFCHEWHELTRKVPGIRVNSCNSWLLPLRNGNMTGRTVGGVTYSLVYDAENRLQQVKQGSTVLDSYTLRQAQGEPYDADGNRAKAVMGDNTTGGLLPRMARIETKAEARFVQISEIRGGESWAVTRRFDDRAGVDRCVGRAARCR